MISKTYWYKARY